MESVVNVMLVFIPQVEMLFVRNVQLIIMHSLDHRSVQLVLLSVRHVIKQMESVQNVRMVIN